MRVEQSYWLALLHSPSEQLCLKPGSIVIVIGDLEVVDHCLVLPASIFSSHIEGMGGHGLSIY